MSARKRFQPFERMELAIPRTDEKVLVDPDICELLSDKRLFLGARGYPMFKQSRDEPPVYLHRFVMGEIPPGRDVDHINRNMLDCRRANLRICSRSENLRNQSKRKGTSSRYKGVSWSTGERKFKAHIRYDGRSRALGTFTSEEEAALAYDRAARQYFGEFAACNFPEGVELIRYVPSYENPTVVYNYCTFNITQKS